MSQEWEDDKKQNKTHEHYQQFMDIQKIPVL